VEALLPPQAPHPFLVDALGLREQRVDTPLPIARMLPGELLDLFQEQRVVGWMGDVAEGRAVHLHQCTRPLHRHPTIYQKLYGCTLLHRD
jgi:hypothetical protein